MESNKDGGNTDPNKKEKAKDSNAVADVDEASKNSPKSTEVSESSPKSTASLAKASPSKTQLEGEDERKVKEPDGPTLLRSKYDKTREDHSELSRDLRDNAMKMMLKMLELQASQRSQAAQTPTGPSQSKKEDQPISETNISQTTAVSGPRESVTGQDVETQLRELEKRVKLSVNRTAESRREQAHLMSLINNLEVKMYKTEEAAYIKEIMSKVPEDVDIEKLKKLQLVMAERKRLEKDIQRLQMEIRAMNNAMANADVIISESSPIKKPRRVVIRTESVCQDKQSSQRLVLNEFANGKTEWQPATTENTLSPEPESPPALAQAPVQAPAPDAPVVNTSAGGSGPYSDEFLEEAKETKPTEAETNVAEAEIVENEVKPEPPSKKDKKSKRK